MMVLIDEWFAQLLTWGFIGCLIVIIAFIVWFSIFWFIRTPKAAKIVKSATNQHRGLAVVQGDDGRVELKIGFKIRPEGIVETKPEGSKPKKSWIGLIARKVEVPKVEAASPTDALEIGNPTTLKIAEFLSDEATKPTFLDGSGIPILFGYRGKAILTRIGHLAGLKGLEKLKELSSDVLVGVDFTTLKTLFPMPWDETQLDAQGQMKFNEGFAAGRRGEDKNREFKILLLMLLGVFGCIAAAALIFKFL